MNSKQSISYLASQCPPPLPNTPEFVQNYLKNQKLNYVEKATTTSMSCCVLGEKIVFFVETTLGSQIKIYVGSLPELLRTSLPGLGELLQCRKRIPGKDVIFWQK